jgi:hypothetical protein
MLLAQAGLEVLLALLCDGASSAERRGACSMRVSGLLWQERGTAEFRGKRTAITHRSLLAENAPGTERAFPLLLSTTQEKTPSREIIYRATRSDR